ncbi:MAG TPA: NAD-dependent epimerase/dehydratase family protein [Pyrinomonadaceae bacterium]|nr:NAD-dependent epimerase/dehydratase family protein [Pyrinomonadaceae bacterium]
MRILVTGSGGFIGGSFGRFAVRAGHTMLGVGRASQPAQDWPGAHAQADVASSDLSDLIASFAPELLLHAAGTASVGASLAHPLDDLRAATLTWANVLDSVRRSGARPLLLFPSSAAVYGDTGDSPAREDAAAHPISPYGYHKAACELLAREYAECFGLSIVVCRLFSVFGEAQRRLLVWELYRQLASDASQVWLEGTGRETRDYLHVEDASAAMLELAEAFAGERARFGSVERDGGGSERDSGNERDGGVCRIVNVESGEETRVVELAERMRALVAPGKEVRCRGLARTGDPQRWRADASLLRALAPRWHPQPFAQRLAQCVAAWQGERQK